MKSRLFAVAPILLSLIGLAGCRHFGPRSVAADRIPYNEAVASSWKEQTLLNIVKIRYMDTPFFVDVPQITSGYTLQGIATANASISPPANPVASFGQQLGGALNLQGGYQDRPTISYAPQTGSQFIRNLTIPINPGSVLYLLQSGYPADVVLPLTVESINGVKNRSVSGGQLRREDPEFNQVVQAIRKAQISGHVGIRVEQKTDQPDSVAFFFHDKNIDPALAKELAEVRRILQLDPVQSEFRVTFGPAAASSNEIAVMSRSVVRVLSELATFVDVPVEHLVSGTAPPIGEQETDAQPPFRVLSCPERPRDSFVTVCYEGHWFWIEKSDYHSKRTMAYLLVLLALADTGAKESLPVITIQAN